MNDLIVSIIQSDLYWEQVDANLAMFEEKIWEIKEQTDLIILPEMFSTGFSMRADVLAEPMNSKTFRWMHQQAEQKMAVVMGSYMVNVSGHHFNRLLAVRPDGTYSVYDKKHLFGLAGEDKDFTRGEERLIFEVKGWRVMPMICYDLRFPVWSRSTQSDQLYEYDLVVYVASWPAPRINAWDTLLQARAIENLAYSVGVNRIGTDGLGVDYIGHSGVYDFMGNAIALLDDKAGHKTVKLGSESLADFRKRFPFQEDADHFKLS